MKKQWFDVAAVSVGNDGTVHLADEELLSLEASLDPAVIVAGGEDDGGGDGTGGTGGSGGSPPSNSGCGNEACVGRSNGMSCTNGIACTRTVNQEWCRNAASCGDGVQNSLGCTNTYISGCAGSSNPLGCSSGGLLRDDF